MFSNAAIYQSGAEKQMKIGWATKREIELSEFVEFLQSPAVTKRPFPRPPAAPRKYKAEARPTRHRLPGLTRDRRPGTPPAPGKGDGTG